MYLEFESPKISLTHPLDSLTCLFRPTKLNSLLCFELLFHKPLKNDILAQRSTSNSSSSEIFPLVTICLASFFSFESSSLTHKLWYQFRATNESWIRIRPIWLFYIAFIDAVYLWLFLESYKIKKIEKKRWITAVRFTRSPQKHSRKRVAAVAARRDMNRPERFIAPLRPCERTCASQVVLVPSFSLPLSFSFSHRQPGFQFRFRTGSRTKSIKIIFTRSAAWIHNDEIGILNRFQSKNWKSMGCRFRRILNRRRKG